MPSSTVSRPGRPDTADAPPEDPGWAELSRLEAALVELDAALLRRSRRHVSAVVGAAGKVAIGTASTASVLGLIGAFGTASTGTAIASLSGAAASSASLYFVGSLVGLRAVAGGAILVAGGIVAGMLGWHAVRRRLWGRPRDAAALSEGERDLHVAARHLLHAIARQRRLARPPAPAELTLVAREAVRPLLARLAAERPGDGAPLIRRWALSGARRSLAAFAKRNAR